MNSELGSITRFCLLFCGYAVGGVLVWSSFTLLVLSHGSLLTVGYRLGLGLALWQFLGWIGRTRRRPIDPR